MRSKASILHTDLASVIFLCIRIVCRLPYRSRKQLISDVTNKLLLSPLQQSQFGSFLFLVVEHNWIKFVSLARRFCVVFVRLRQVVKSLCIRLPLHSSLFFLFFKAISLPTTHPHIEICQEAEKQHSSNKEEYDESQRRLVEKHHAGFLKIFNSDENAAL